MKRMLCCAACFAALSPALPQGYTLVEIAPGLGLGGGRVNDSGMWVGWNTQSNGRDRAVVWDSGTTIYPGTLNGNESQAFSVNNSGKVVGTYWGGSATQNYAFTYQNGSMAQMTPYHGAWFPWRINDAGRVALDNDGGEHGYVYDQGVYTSVGVSGTANNIRGLSPSGIVAGDVETHDNDHPRRAFSWLNGTMTVYGAVNNGYRSSAWDVNDSGAVVGESDTDAGGANQRAVVWQGDQMNTLDLLPGYVGNSATGINGEGTIIGWALDSASHWTGWVYKNGQMTDLSQYFPDDWDFISPWDISENGVISGIAGYSPGYGRGFALVPFGTTWGPVPEPSGFVALSMALAACLIFRKPKTKA